MTETHSSRTVDTGKHSTRRDYSKVSGALELPNLVEIQTDSFDWFKKTGIKEVFDDIYPIQNYSGNIRLKLIDFEFEEPKYSVSESKYRCQIKTVQAAEDAFPDISLIDRKIKDPKQRKEHQRRRNHIHSGQEKSVHRFSSLKTVSVLYQAARAMSN